MSGSDHRWQFVPPFSVDDILIFPAIFAIKSWRCLTLRRNFDVFVSRLFRWRPAQISDQILSHRQTYGKVWWRSTDRRRRLDGQKRKNVDLNNSGKTEWPDTGSASMGNGQNPPWTKSPPDIIPPGQNVPHTRTKCPLPVILKWNQRACNYISFTWRHAHSYDM